MYTYKHILKLLLIVVFFKIALCNERDSDNTTLQLVFVIFRHGERTPETNEGFPNDPYTIDYFYPLTYGQITKEGKQRQYRLGKKLRKRYGDFLGQIYRSEQVIAYTTDWDRTKTSLQLTLAGLFPPHPSQQWDQELLWLPIPYQYSPTNQDYLIRRPDPYCPKYMEELHKVFQSEEAQRVFRQYKKLFDYITTNSGRNMSDFHEVFRVYQNIHSKKLMNLTIPEWAKSIYPEPLHTMASYQCLFENYNDKLLRLNGGHILQKFIEISTDKIRGCLVPPGRQIYLYSGHENNIVNILAVLKVYEQHLPPYCSAVMLELHKNTSNEFGFKIFYDNSTDVEEIHNLVMPGCTPFCPFEKFINLTKAVVPVNYTAECESPVYLD